MKLEEVLTGVQITVAAGVPWSSPVAGLEYDSRRVKPGFLFFAFPGARTDGRRFAQAAIENGALAVVSESERPDDFPGPWICVGHGRRALAITAKNFHGRLDERLNLTGITGTNGKTTTSYLVDSILRAAGKQTGLVGTIEYRIAGEAFSAVNTTPESLDLFRIFEKVERAGGTHVTAEISSHALALGRVFGIFFHTAVFTNLTRDHLDFHGTMEEYFRAKRLLFHPDGAPPPPYAAINADDASGREIHPAPETKVFWYGLGEQAAVRAIDVETGFHGLRFTLAYDGGRTPVESPLLGKVNVYNLLAAAATALTYDIDQEAILTGIAECPQVPGRFERIDEGQSFLVIVDYAHTDDALRNAIATARGLNAERVITLFGCGGDRDRAKRPLMGMAAAEASDFVVLTSDNPRSEDPLAIINDALVGLRRFDTPHVIEPDREKAIRLAIKEAGARDVVLLAGKGHETYQVLKDRTIHLDDREVARSVLRGFGYGS